MKRSELEPEDLKMIDYYLESLATERNKITSLNNTPDERDRLNELEKEYAYKCYAVNKDFAVDTWRDIKF